MSFFTQIHSICRVCNTKFDTEILTLATYTDSGFYADLQPRNSGIWESQLLSCPNCGYTSHGPMFCEYPPFSQEMSEFVKTTLTPLTTLIPFVKRQKRSINSSPSLTCKYELYALELDFLQFEDQLIGDQFLRASWSASPRWSEKITQRADETRRLRSLAADRYEKALLTTAYQVVEDELIVRYLLVELYRLLGEEGLQILHLEKLKEFKGESMQSDYLIEIAERQREEPDEDRVIGAAVGLMDFLGNYRSNILISHAYVALRENNLEKAATLFKRVLGICEGPLRSNLYRAGRAKLDLPMNINIPLDSYGAQAAIGLQEVYRQMDIRDNEVTLRLNSLVKMIERQQDVSADKACAKYIKSATLPQKSGWQYFSRVTKDPKPSGAFILLDDSSKNRKNEVSDLRQKSLEYIDDGSIDLAYDQAKKVVSLCEHEIAGIDYGMDEYFKFARIRLESQALVGIYQLTHNDDTSTVIQYIEKVLEEYHAIGGPSTLHLFSFLLILISKAYEQKEDSIKAAKAKEKAFELVADDPKVLFHWGRWLMRCKATEAEAESVLFKAMKKGADRKSWVEGASAFMLAKMFVYQGRKVEASDLIKRSVLSDFVHTPGLWGHPFIKDNIPDVLKWAESFYKSQKGQDQLRPNWRGSTTSGNSKCSICGQRIPLSQSDKVLVVSADDIHEWLRSGDPIGLVCNECGVFGACCWNWHTYDDWNHLDTPIFAPLCPRCGKPLTGAQGQKVRS